MGESTGVSVPVEEFVWEEAAVIRHTRTREFRSVFFMGPILISREGMASA
jgi:hypothetical protein